MNNPNMTAKERNLLKGAIRRVFSRSEVRKAALSRCEVDITSLNRPRVKKWCYCYDCERYTPKYLMQVDHLSPIIPVELSLEHIISDDELGWTYLIDSTWCDPKNLIAKCIDCHKIKTKLENKKRREWKKRVLLEKSNALPPTMSTLTPLVHSTVMEAPTVSPVAPTSKKLKVSKKRLKRSKKKILNKR